MSGPGDKAAGPKVPYRQVSRPEIPSPTATAGKGTGSKAGGPKVPYRQVSGGTPAPTTPERRTPGSRGTGARVTVTVDDAHLGDVEGVAERLRAEGLEVDQVLGDIGIITGSVSPDKRKSVGGLEGVGAVEDEATFQLPPPEAGIQ